MFYKKFTNKWELMTRWWNLWHAYFENKISQLFHVKQNDKYLHPFIKNVTFFSKRLLNGDDLAKSMALIQSKEVKNGFFKSKYMKISHLRNINLGLTLIDGWNM